MSKYKCECGETKDVSGVTIKVIDGAVRHDVKCDCGKYMEPTEKKTGVPSFRSNRYGQVR
jgi:hypothetical protein